MMDDIELLRRYAETRDEAAFTELVQRRFDGVYSAALRRMGGDAHLARDVAQQVFLALAREARRLAAHPALSGWLHRATRNAAGNAVRGERRRKAHEQEAHAMQDALSQGPADADWNRLAPLIETAVDQLNDGDRVAVLLRFFERRTFAEIGRHLRVTEDGARKKIDRATEKLRLVLERQGIRSTAAALGAALSAHAVTAAPPGLATAVASTALAGAATGGGLTLFTLMSMTKIQAGIASGLLVAATAGIVALQGTNAQLERELAALRGPRAESSGKSSSQSAAAAVNRDDDLRLLASGLRAQGLAPGAIYSVLAGQIRARFAAKREKIFDDKGIPFWQRGNPSTGIGQILLRLDRELQLALLEAEAIAGGPPTEITAARMAKYGKIDPRKHAQLDKIEADYAQLSLKLSEDFRGIAEMTKSRVLLAQNQKRDLAAVLSAEELVEYQRRAAPSAEHLKRTIVGIDVTEPEYNSLITIQQKIDDAVQAMPPTDFYTRQAVRVAAHLDETRALLGEGRFRKVLAQEDAAFNTYENYAKSLGLNPDVADRLFELERETRNNLAAMQGLSPVERTRAELASATRIKARLHEIIGPKNSSDFLAHVKAGSIKLLLVRDAYFQGK